MSLYHPCHLHAFAFLSPHNMRQFFSRSTLLVLLAIFLINIRYADGQRSPWNIKQNPFPKAKRVSKTLTYRSAKAKGNVTLADPYQWLQNDDDPDTKSFIADQIRLTETFINKCSSVKQIEESVREAFNYDDYSNMIFFDNAKIPFWFYSVVRPNEERSTFYIATPDEMEAAKKANFPNPPGKKYLQEAALSPNGTATVASFVTSLDRTKIAYLVVEEDSGSGTWYVRNLDSPLINPKKIVPGGEGRLPIAIPNGYQDLKWTLDSKGFFYNQISTPTNGTNNNPRTVVKYHEMGTPYEKDITLVHPEANLDNYWFLDYSADGRWLVVWGNVGTDQKAIAYATLLEGQKLSENMKWISILPTLEYSIFYSVGVLDDYWYVTTDEDALNKKVVKAKLDWNKSRQVKKLSDLKDRIKFIDVVPNQPFHGLYLAIPSNKDKAILLYIENGNYVTYLYDLSSGKMLQKILPEETSSIHAIAFAGINSKYITFMYRSTVSPVKIYSLHHANSQVEATLLTAQKIRGSNPDDYITERLEAVSKDGVHVPYFIVRHKNRPSNTSSLVWVHGYGAYGDIDNLYWYETYFTFLRGGNDRVFVWASLRGGGDEGEEWHIAGKRRQKQKTYDDMVAVAQDLVKRNIGVRGQMIVEGTSSGGMMAAVVARQAPSGLFGVALPDLAVLDYLYANSGVNGPANTDEFGDPNIPIEFDIIESWDPIRNLSPKIQPPPTLLTVGDSDDTVSPGNTYKYLAQAQYDHPNSVNPVLMHVDVSSGHALGRLATKTAIAKAVNQLCFIELTIGKNSKRQ